MLCLTTFSLVCMARLLLKDLLSLNVAQSQQSSILRKSCKVDGVFVLAVTLLPLLSGA